MHHRIAIVGGLLLHWSVPTMTGYSCGGDGGWAVMVMVAVAVVMTVSPLCRFVVEMNTHVPAE